MSDGMTPTGKAEQRASFTRQFVIATAEDCKAKWACRNDSKAFFCAFCRHDFVEGDEFRMVYSNDLPDARGNPLTCKPCWDGHGGFEGLRKLWRELWAEYEDKFKWWWIR